MEQVVYFFFARRAIGWAVAKERQWSKGVGCAIVVVALLGLATYRYLPIYTPNYYHELGVPPMASRARVQAGFRRQSLLYHPDRALDKDKAPAKFAKISSASETLSDPRKRQTYQNFGDMKIKTLGKREVAELLVVFIVYGVMRLFMGLFYSVLYGAGFSWERFDGLSTRLYLAGVVLAFFLELLLRFHPAADSDILGRYVPFLGTHLLPFERVAFLRIAVPLLLNGLMILMSESNEGGVVFSVLDNKKSLSLQLYKAAEDQRQLLERELCAIEDTLQYGSKVDRQAKAKDRLSLTGWMRIGCPIEQHFETTDDLLTYCRNQLKDQATGRRRYDLILFGLSTAFLLYSQVKA